MQRICATYPEGASPDDQGYFYFIQVGQSPRLALFNSTQLNHIKPSQAKNKLHGQDEICIELFILLLICTVSHYCTICHNKIWRQLAIQYHYSFIGRMSNQARVKHCSIFSEQGRPLKYDQYVHYGHKRHYWGNPNKNFGFYTSEQLDQLSRRVKTESTHQSTPYRVQNEGKFIVNALNPEEVHCCTCHNNPRRYAKNAQKCSFCEEHAKQYQSLSVSTKKQSRNRNISPIQKQRVDEKIQVSLPRMHHHNHKHQVRCLACKEKAKSRRKLNLPASNLFQDSAKKMLMNQLEGSYRQTRRGRNLKSQFYE